MSRHDTLIEALLDEARLTLDELCRAAAVTPRWVEERVVDGLLDVSRRADDDPSAPPSGWQFGGVELRRVRRMVRVERDFDARPELAALVADLQDEVERLRTRLHRHGLG